MTTPSFLSQDLPGTLLQFGWEQQNALIAVQNVISAPDADLEGLMAVVVDSARFMLPQADGVVIEMQEGDSLWCRAASGILSEDVGRRIPIAGSFAGMCLEKNEALYCRDARSDPRANQIICAELSIRSMMVLPIRHRGTVIGVFKIAACAADAFSDSDQWIAQFFVNAIATGFGSMAEMAAIQALKESEARFQRAVRGSSEGIWDWDLITRRIYYSPRFKALLGYEEHEIGDAIEDWAQLLHPEDVDGVMQKIERHFTQKVPYVAPYRLRRKSGDYAWFEARGETERSEDDTPLRMSGCLRDIGDQKRLERIQEEFVYTVTHELRTPLTSLKGALDMMAGLYKEQMPQAAHEMLKLALNGSQRLMFLINDLLDMGKMEAGKMAYRMEGVELNGLLRETIEANAPYGRKYFVDYLLYPTNDALQVQIDQERFHQLMANLLSNAAKFTHAGDVVEVGVQQHTDHCLVIVTDHGQGIAAEFQPHVFEKFTQGQSGHGTGLGLSIAKTIAEDMGGNLWFESAAGQGTKFYLRLPVEKRIA